MSNSYFQFKLFTIQQDRSAMKVTTDACLFGAWVAEEMKNEKLKINNVLDLGAGTGLLSLMLAQKNPDAVIDAIEIEENAYQQAKENIAASPFANQIHPIHGDARNFLFVKKYDLIISNPPFYENELKSGKGNKNIAHHGEELSLAELLTVIKENLAEDGSFFLLLPYKRLADLGKLFTDHGLGFTEMIFVRQSTKHGYFRILLKGKLKTGNEEEIEINEVSIWNDQQQYTREFIELLKDYYLNL